MEEISAQTDFTNKVIIVIDDHYTAAIGRAKKIKKHFSCEAVAARDPNDLRTLLIRSRQENLKIAGIISDEGMDISGTEILHDLRQGNLDMFYPNARAIPMAIVTGDNSRIAMEEAFPNIPEVTVLSKSQWKNFDRKKEYSSLGHIISEMLKGERIVNPDRENEKMTAREGERLIREASSRDPTGYHPDDSVYIRDLKQKSEQTTQL